MSQAVLFLLIATSLFSIINVGVKFLDHIPASEIVVFRALVSFLICFYFIRKKNIPLLGKNLKLLFMRGLFGTFALASLFFCLQKIPLAVASTLINLTPILTVVIAHFYLKEKASPMQWFFLLFSFVGVYFVRGGIEPIPIHWMLLGVFSALCASIAYTCVRQLRLSEDPLVVIMYFPLITVPLMGPVMAYQWVTPVKTDWLVLIGIGVLTQIAQYFMTLAYQMEQASKVMIFNYTGLFWGILFGYIVFQEDLTQRQLWGILVVFLCLCGNYVVSQKRKHQL